MPCVSSASLDILMKCLSDAVFNWSSLITTNLTGDHSGQTSVKFKTFLEKYVRGKAVFILLIRREDIYTLLVNEIQSEYKIEWESNVNSKLPKHKSVLNNLITTHFLQYSSCFHDKCSFCIVVFLTSDVQIIVIASFSEVSSRYSLVSDVFVHIS